MLAQILRGPDNLQQVEARLQDHRFLLSDTRTCRGWQAA
jgi:hypothetical protein